MSTSRDLVRRRQSELLAALLVDGGEPAGFDSSRLAVVRAALRSKRARAIAKLWPGLAGSLGSDLEGQLDRYFELHAVSPVGGPVADGRAFARFLAAAGQLPWAGHRELLGAETTHRWLDRGRRRRRFGVGVAVGARPYRMALVVRLPMLGTRWLL